MKRRSNLLILIVVMALGLSLSTFVLGQKNTSKMLYHDGPVMTGTSNVYFIWYGDWSGNTAPQILGELVASLGGSSYFRINTTYPDGSGAAPSGGLVYSGAATDLYSHGYALGETD